MFRFDKNFAAAFAMVLSFCGSAQAVYLNPDGLGQALIYPYYTARSGGGNPFNTYISVANTGRSAKMLRVRFREAAGGQEVAGFNLFLGPWDMWTGAVVPHGRGAKLITADASCVDPDLTRVAGRLPELVFSGVEASTEGYVEMIEMATAVDGSDTFQAVASRVDGFPRDCGFVRGAIDRVTPDAQAPTGELMGTLTLINVANGEDFTVTADALANLSTQQFFRAASDPYPDFHAAEVTSRSQMFVGGVTYDLEWSNGVEAVSSVLMASRVFNEYVLDRGTGSQTDWVLTYPTRRYFPDPLPLFAFGRQGNLEFQFSNRTGRMGTTRRCSDFVLPPPCGEEYRLGATNVLAIANGSAPPSSLLGSSRVLPPWLALASQLESGWIQVSHIGDPDPGPQLVSLPGSRAFDPATGSTTPGTFAVRGLPVTGLALRTFRNGTLKCGTASCQGNYGGSFSHRYQRAIELVP